MTRTRIVGVTTVNGDPGIRARLARARPTRRATWVAPALLGSVVTGYLAWGAWVSAADRQWLYQTQAWWRVWLRPGYGTAPLVFTGLWLAALLCYWYPRRLVPHVVGHHHGGNHGADRRSPHLGVAGHVPGRPDAGRSGRWVLDMYVGNPPSFPLGACNVPLPLAYQVGGPVCLGATLMGALTVAAVLWRQPVDRLRARLVRDATILTGLDSMTIPVLQRLAQTFRPAEHRRDRARRQPSAAG